VDTSADAQLGPERDQTLKLAILVLLEKLPPTERAAYVLREAFDYPYGQIAEILRIEEANARQLVTRARKHVSEGRRTSADSAEQRKLLAAFLEAARKGDMAALEGLFAEDVVSVADGGGLVRAARFPVCGRERVAKFIAAVSHFWKGLTVEWVEANGQAAVLILRDGSVVALATVDVSEKGIDQILWIMRPSKLNAVSRTGRSTSDDSPSESSVS
jgi:RNA polymerase sigma-70 factor (ECF subfamily)